MTNDTLGYGMPTLVALSTALISWLASLQFGKEDAAFLTGLAAIITAVFGLFRARRADANARRVADIAANAVIKTNAKSVFVERVTAERAVWRREIRAATTELVAMLSWSARGQKIDWHQVLRLCSELRLRLNPAGRESKTGRTHPHEHEHDHKAHAFLSGIEETSGRARREHLQLAKGLESVIADLLKQEWEKSKDEARAGDLAPKEKPTKASAG